MVYERLFRQFRVDIQQQPVDGSAELHAAFIGNPFCRLANIA